MSFSAGHKATTVCENVAYPIWDIANVAVLEESGKRSIDMSNRPSLFVVVEASLLFEDSKTDAPMIAVRRFLSTTYPCAWKFEDVREQDCSKQKTIATKQLIVFRNRLTSYSQRRRKDRFNIELGGRLTKPRSSNQWANYRFRPSDPSARRSAKS